MRPSASERLSASSRPSKLEQPAAHSQVAEGQGRRVARRDQELRPGRGVLAEDGDDPQAPRALEQVQGIQSESHLP